jgi:hypothetical protein
MVARTLSLNLNRIINLNWRNLVGVFTLLTGLQSISAQNTPIKISWDYCQPEKYVVFEVWESVDLQEWKLLTITKNKWLIIEAAGYKFFRVKALNTYTTKESDWASTSSCP